MAKSTGYEVVNPFSESFTKHWELWKIYKKEDHRFEYRSPISEQAGLNELVDLADGDETEAIRIINRSMSNNWKGLFRIHKPKNPKKDGKATSIQEGADGKSSTKTGGTEKSSFDDLKVAHLKRYGNGSQTGS